MLWKDKKQKRIGRLRETPRADPRLSGTNGTGAGRQHRWWEQSRQPDSGRGTSAATREEHPSRAIRPSPSVISTQEISLKRKKKMPWTSGLKIRLWLKQAFKNGYNFESLFRLTLTSFKLYIRISLPRSQPTHNILRCQWAKSCASERSKRNHRLEKKLWAEIIFHCCKWHRRMRWDGNSRRNQE